MIESLAEERNQRIMESQKIVEKIKLKPCPFCGGTAQFKNPVNKGLYGYCYCNLGFYAVEKKEVEVIGNIFDNPELIAERRKDE